MAAKAEGWDHIVITPCYILYEQECKSSLFVLHSLWDEWEPILGMTDDIEDQVQAWHWVQALLQIFRDRREWDEGQRTPFPIQRGVPLWVRKGIKPATQEWMEHWKAHPEEQPSMTRHAMRQREKAEALG